MTATNVLDPKLFPETAKFQGWLASQREEGLVDVKFYPSKVEDATIESFFAEVNGIIRAEAIDDTEFF